MGSISSDGSTLYGASAVPQLGKGSFPSHVLSQTQAGAGLQDTLWLQRARTYLQEPQSIVTQDQQHIDKYKKKFKQSWRFTPYNESPYNPLNYVLVQFTP